MADGDHSARIDQLIANLGDWRGETLATARKLIRAADKEVVEEVKWVKAATPDGVATWNHDGILCTGEVYKAYVKLSFHSGAALDDPASLFNAGFGGGSRRSIDLHEGDGLPAKAFTALVKQAVAHNVAKKAAKGK